MCGERPESNQFRIDVFINGLILMMTRDEGRVLIKGRVSRHGRGSGGQGTDRPTSWRTFVNPVPISFASWRMFMRPVAWNGLVLSSACKAGML